MIIKNKNKIMKLSMIVLFALSILPALATATTISIGDYNVAPSGEVTVPIMINGVTNVGAADIDLLYDSSVVHVTKVINGDFEFTDSTINNVTGVTRIYALQLLGSGLNGNVKLAEVTLKAIGSAGKSSPLRLSVYTLKTKESIPKNIPATPVNGSFKIAIPTNVSIGDYRVAIGKEVTVPIMINNVTNVGAANIDLLYDSSVVHVTKVINGDFDFTDSTINNVTGITNIGGLQLLSAGLNGNVKLAEVTLQAVGSAGDSSPLNISIRYLATKEPIPKDIPATPVNGTFTITGPTISIYTDKSSYKVGDTHKLGLNITNPGNAISVVVKIWLSGPKYYPLIDQKVTLKANLKYNNPSFRSFTIPKIPSGTYTWHAQIMDPVTSAVLSKDTAVWTLT